MKRSLFYTLSILIVWNTNQLFAIESDTSNTSIFNQSIEELIGQEVSIATKSSQKLSQTPSVVSVITAEEIKVMGYRDLHEVLQTIPGFETNQIRFGSRAMGIRGVNSARQGGRLLVLLDGSTYNDIMYGSALFFGSEFNLDAIEKIEVIRGPGSALYGRNAYSGVVNIITKKAKSNIQAEADFSYGSYNTYDARASYGLKKEEFNANIMARYYTTETTDSKYNNGEGGESIWNIGHKNYYINANAQYKDFQFFGSFTQRNDGINTATSLGDFITNGNTQFNIGTYSLLYNKDIASNTSLNIKLYGRNEYRHQDFELTTPNTTDTFELAGIPFNSIYTQGGYAEPVFDAYTYGAEVEFSIQLSKNNKLLAGVQADLYGVKNASVKTNYDLTTSAPIPDPNTGQQYTKEEMPVYEPGWMLNGGHDYNNIAIYAQDVHYFTDNLSLTLGGRLDFDSEVDQSINPRIGLVWEPSNKSSVKLLYGKAYRAPTANEQYKIMGADMGNAALKHEEINTAELVFAHQFEKFYAQTSLFYNVLDNLVVRQKTEEDPNIISYFNTGQNISYGVEFESKYKITNNLYSFANYSYTQSEDIQDATGEDIKTQHPNISDHKFNIGLNARIHKKVNWSFLLHYRGEIEKFLDQEPDATPPYVSQDKVGNFFILNSTIVYNVFKDFNLSLQGYNLLNTTYYYQDDVYEHQPKQPGIHFLIRASYNFHL
jgi:outer membrane receptor for ferrienterochelin and colicins